MPQQPIKKGLDASDLSLPADDFGPAQEPGIIDRIKSWADEKLAPRSTPPVDPNSGWSTGSPMLDQAASSLVDAVRGGVRSITAPFIHPVQTAEGMGKTIQAGGMAPGGMYPIPQSPETQIQAQRDLQPGIESMKKNKADTAGSIIGPILAGKALGAVAGSIDDAADAAGGYKPLIRSKITDVLAPGSPAELLTRALKPGVEIPKPTEILDRSLPDVIGAADNRPTSVEQYGAAADRARSYNQAAYRGLFNGENYAGRPIGETPVSTTPLARAITNSVSPAHDFENPITGAVDALDEKAQHYAGNTTTLSTLDNIRETRNAELNNIFASSPADRGSLVRANPDLAAKMAMRSAAADQTYGTLAEETGFPEEAIRANRDAYGDLRDTADVANKRATVYGRQNPISLPEQIALNGPGRIRNFIFNRIFKDATGSDALVDAATRRYIASHPDDGGFAQTGTSGPGKPFSPAGLLGPGGNDGVIDSDTLGLPDSSLGNPMGWSGNTTGAKVPIGTYKPPIGYPVPPDQVPPLTGPGNFDPAKAAPPPPGLPAEASAPREALPPEDLEKLNLIDIIRRQK